MAKISDIALLAAVAGGLYIIWNMGKDAFAGISQAAGAVSQPIQAVQGAVSGVGDAIYNAGYTVGSTQKAIQDTIYNAGYSAGQTTKQVLSNPDNIGLLTAVLGGPQGIASWAVSQIAGSSSAPSPSPAPSPTPAQVYTKEDVLASIKPISTNIQVAGVVPGVPAPKMKSAGQETVVIPTTIQVPAAKGKTAKKTSEELLQVFDKQKVTVNGSTMSVNDYAALRGWA